MTDREPALRSAQRQAVLTLSSPDSATLGCSSTQAASSVVKTWQLAAVESGTAH